MKPKKIHAIEKDKKLALFLKNIFKDFKNIKKPIKKFIYENKVRKNNFL